MFKKRQLSQNYYTNRGNELRSRRALSNKFHSIKNIVFKLCIVLLFLGMLYAIFFTPVLAVKNVIVEGNKAVNGSEIQEAVLSFTGRKILKIFNNNLFFVSSADLKSIIVNQYDNIESVEIEKKYPATIKIIIKEKPADIAWCNKIKIEKAVIEKNISADQFLASEIPQCYLSDENGLIYKKIGDNIPSNSVKVFQDESINEGSKIADENLKNFIRNIFYNFNDKTGLNLAYLYMLPPASRELHLVTSENMKIYFDLNRSADEQLSDLSAFIKDELKKKDNKSINYDYIDLRIVDRIIVLPKSEDKK